MTVDNDSTPTTWLVTGANRGIGFGLVTHLLNRPNTIVFATARNPAIAHDLNKLSKRFPDRLHVLKFEVTSRDEGLAAAEQVKQIVGTNGLDVVIANAGVSLGLGPIATTSPQSFIDNFKVNTLGPLNTFQVFYPLLKIGKQKKFFVISSTIGSVTEIARFAEIADMPYEAYGASKAAVNHLARKMYYEHRDEGFIICPFCPGHVATDMGNAGAKAAGLEQAPVAVDDSAKGLLKVMETATQEQGGRFWNYEGKEVPW